MLNAAVLGLCLSLFFPTFASAELRDDLGYKIAVSVVSESEAQDLFEKVSAMTDLAFDYPDEFCESRAHEMARRLEAMGVNVGKIWVGGKFYMPSDFADAGIIGWSYHVAPFVLIDKNGRQEVLILDPATFAHPVLEDEWIANLLRDSRSSLRQTHYSNRFLFQPAFVFGTRELVFSKRHSDWNLIDITEAKRRLERGLVKLSVAN